MSDEAIRLVELARTEIEVLETGIIAARVKLDEAIECLKLQLNE